MTIIRSTNPAKNFQVIGEIPATTPADLQKTVERANHAKKEWASLGLAKRKEYISALYELCKKRAKDIALCITREVGTPISASLDEVLWNKGYFEWFLAHADEALSPDVVGQDAGSRHTVYYEPIGTAAVITPWNLPFDMFVWGAIPNLIAGNTVIYKAAEECAMTGKLLEEICLGAGLPEGVLSFVHGDAQTGAALVDQDIDLIWFTGSTEVGQTLYRLAGKKFIKAILEMGGSNPAIMFEDADIDTAVNSIISKRFMFCGQTCDADKRLLVHRSILQTVVAKLKKKINDMPVGDPELSDTVLGPLVSQKQLDLLVSQVDDAVRSGAVIETGGRSPETFRGAYYLPTLVTNVNRTMRIWKEEVFGPVLPVQSFSTEDEAITLANDTVYGLGSQIFTKNRKKALRVALQLQAGNVDINGVGHFRPYNPFGGYKNSGMGREHGIDGFRELCQVKIVSENK
jgi:succinate-semialdehyde dehydrogenase/glutarate-semialdehyde dehydrogenase